VTYVSDLFLDRPAVERMVSRAGEARAAISRRMSQTMGEIQGLSGAGLSGAANAALQEAAVQIEQGFGKVLGALDDLSSQLSGALRQISDRDDSAGSDIRTATQSIGDTPITNALTGTQTR
jgi:ESAT-6 family protein